MFLPVAEYVKLPHPETPWWIEGLLSDGGMCLLYGKAKEGKAVALDTPILTPLGWRTIADIQPGDEVFGSDGRPAKVYAVSPIRHDRVCYRVVFDDGETIVADAEHEWTVYSRQGRWDATMTTQSLLDAGEFTNEGRYPRPHWRVRLGQVVQFPEAKVPLGLDSYLLGLWLGDGTTDTGGYTSADPELVNAWGAAGWTVTHNKCRPYHWNVLKLVTTLRMLGVVGNKHIPEVYMRGSVAERKALLAGLLDTDGSVHGGSVFFYNKNKRLVLQVQELAQQLGYRVRWHEKRAMLKGKDCGPFYQLSIRAHEQVFRLARKAAKFRVNTERYQSIVAITPTSSVPVKCLCVDTPDHLFLVGRSCIPTHNSMAAMTMAVALLNNWETVLGCAIHRYPKRICYLQIDTPRLEQLSRFEAVILAGHGVEGMYTTDTLLAPYPFNILNPAIEGAAETLRRAIADLNPDIIIIDTFRDLHFADENDASAMQKVVTILRDITLHKTLILIAHARKVSQAAALLESDLIEDARGSSVLVGKVDTIARLRIDGKTRKGTLAMVSRGFPLTTRNIHMEAHPPHLLFPQVDETGQEMAAAKHLLKLKPAASHRELAKELAELLQMSETTARRRLLAAIKEQER